ncbi:MAG: ABC transporter permease subunit [Alphaproteobacteria bacterium]|nr:MAG: ABC transporter permease subunit [Alphaproteobacteria bacterium]
MTEFVRRYGAVMTGYILLACGLWIFVMIVIPQGMVTYYTSWYIDRNYTGKLTRQIDEMYAELDKVDAAIAKLEREIAAAGASAKAELKRKLSEATRRQKEIEEALPPLEAEWSASRTRRTYSWRNYEYLITNADHRAVFLKTIWASVLVTGLALIFCYPIAYYLAKVAAAEKAAILMLGLIIPYWVNELLRVFAWQMILSGRGVLNLVLSLFGLVDLDSIDPPPPNYLGDTGVMLGMIYAYILFMVFPLYNVMETLDKNQIEAARDLGAPWIEIHRHVVIPHAKPGIAVGCIMTFMLAAGSYAVPMALSGGRSQWFTQIIYTWTNDTLDLNLGATYALVLLVLCIVFILIMMRLTGVSLRDIAK